MIDFSQLVLAPCQGVFGAPITVTPIKSQPTAPAFSARGIWHIENVTIVTEDGGNFSNRNIKLGLRVADFSVFPVQGDQVSTAASYLPMAYDIDPAVFVIDDVNHDGQGGASLTLRRA